LCFSLGIRGLVPAVPRKSLHPLHAPSTPVAVCPVIRHPTGLSQKGYTLLVLTTFASLRRVFEGFTFVRLSDAHLHELFSYFSSNAHHHGSLPQQLEGGLRHEKPEGVRDARSRNTGAQECLRREEPPGRSDIEERLEKLENGLKNPRKGRGDSRRSSWCPDS
jgi:hypothetical protein